jgi:hypothetical protein
MRGNFAVRCTSASADSCGPGQITPPRYSPFAEVDHDNRQALAVRLKRRDRVDDAIGADLGGVVDQNRDAGIDRRLEHERHASEVFRDHRDQRAGERWHHRRDHDPGDLAAANLIAVAEIGDQDAEFVGRPLADRRQAPAAHQRLAAKYADHDVGVSDVNCQQHRS